MPATAGEILGYLDRAHKAMDMPELGNMNIDYVAGDQVALFVKKGAVSFKVAVYARIPAEEKEAMELKLAREVVAKL